MKIIDKSVYSFSKDNKPFLTAKPGELLTFKTMDCFGDQIKSEEQLVHEIDFSLANPAAGPVYIEGANVGDVLVVDILDIQVAETGFACTLEGIGPFQKYCDVTTKLFNVENGYTEFNGVKWAVEPMIGVIGTAPSGEDVPCGYPGDHGGNMDSNKIVKGVRMYFPVRVEGALFQLGDLHASMGDGELTGTGIEIAGEVLVKTSLIKKFELNWPVTETKDKWYINSSKPIYDDAVVAACDELVRLMEPVYKWSKSDLAIYISLQGGIEVNQSSRPANQAVDLTLRLGIPKLAGKKLIGN